MNIPDPAVNYGDSVMVHNYRSKRKDGLKLWEEGVVRGLSYRNDLGEFSWYYEVMLVRRSNKNKVMWLYVGDDEIKKNY
jgi:hypothetical protein